MFKFVQYKYKKDMCGDEKAEKITDELRRKRGYISLLVIVYFN